MMSSGEAAMCWAMVGLEEVVGHARRPGPGPRRPFVEVVAVAAGQVAGRAGRLDEDLEPARRNGHERMILCPSLLRLTRTRDRPAPARPTVEGADEIGDANGDEPAVADGRVGAAPADD